MLHQVIHLPWESLTADPKDTTLPGCLKIDWSWLERVVRVVDLLSEIKGVVHAGGASARGNHSIERRRSEGVINREVLAYYLLALLHRSAVEGALSCSTKEVFLSFTECLQ